MFDACMDTVTLTNKTDDSDHSLVESWALDRSTAVNLPYDCAKFTLSLEVKTNCDELSHFKCVPDTVQVYIMISPSHKCVRPLGLETSSCTTPLTRIVIFRTVIATLSISTSSAAYICKCLEIPLIVRLHNFHHGRQHASSTNYCTHRCNSSIPY